MRFFSALVMGLVKVEAEEYTYYSIFARLYGVQNGLYFEEGGGGSYALNRAAACGNTNALRYSP
jgi:hypothetical protein